MTTVLLMHASHMKQMAWQLLLAHCNVSYIDCSAQIDMKRGL